MIDVLAGAIKYAQEDTQLMGYFPDAQHRIIYLDMSSEPQELYPRAIIRHVSTTWKYGMLGTGTRQRDDKTTFKFIVHGDDLPTLNLIQLRLRAIFEFQTFNLIASDGSTVSNTIAQLVSCVEAPGGTIETLPQHNTKMKSIHRLEIRFACEVRRHLS